MAREKSEYTAERDRVIMGLWWSGADIARILAEVNGRKFAGQVANLCAKSLYCIIEREDNRRKNKRTHGPELPCGRYIDEMPGGKCHCGGECYAGDWCPISTAPKSYLAEPKKIYEI